tara:strand:- start:119 stop:337 length:219 start_codon:yes stop_codon:yes gene_type:complete
MLACAANLLSDKGAVEVLAGVWFADIIRLAAAFLAATTLGLAASLLAAANLALEALAAALALSNALCPEAFL